MSITDRFQSAIERMQSAEMINLAKLFFDNRDIHLSARDLRIAGLLTNDLSSKRNFLNQYYGFVFDKIGNSWQLIDVTLNNKKRKTVKRSRKRLAIKSIEKTATQVRIDSVFN
jgi:hypothetical protein